MRDLMNEAALARVDASIKQNREWAVRLGQKCRTDPQHHGHRLRLCNDAWVELEKERNTLLGRHPDSIPT